MEKTKGSGVQAPLQAQPAPHGGAQVSGIEGRRKQDPVGPLPVCQARFTPGRDAPLEPSNPRRDCMSCSDSHRTLAAQAIYAQKRRTVPLEGTFREQRE